MFCRGEKITASNADHCPERVDPGGRVGDHLLGVVEAMPATAGEPR